MPPGARARVGRPRRRSRSGGRHPIGRCSLPIIACGRSRNPSTSHGRDRQPSAPTDASRWVCSSCWMAAAVPRRPVQARRGLEDRAPLCGIPAALQRHAELGGEGVEPGLGNRSGENRAGNVRRPCSTWSSSVPNIARKRRRKSASSSSLLKIAAGTARGPLPRARPGVRRSMASPSRHLAARSAASGNGHEARAPRSRRGRRRRYRSWGCRVRPAVRPAPGAGRDLGGRAPVIARVRRDGGGAARRRPPAEDEPVPSATQRAAVERIAGPGPEPVVRRVAEGVLTGDRDQLPGRVEPRRRVGGVGPELAGTRKRPRRSTVSGGLVNLGRTSPAEPKISDRPSGVNASSLPAQVSTRQTRPESSTTIRSRSPFRNAAGPGQALEAPHRPGRHVHPPGVIEDVEPGRVSRHR